jgi:hypothetical protein
MQEFVKKGGPNSDRLFLRLMCQMSLMYQCSGAYLSVTRLDAADNCMNPSRLSVPSGLRTGADHALLKVLSPFCVALVTPLSF